MNNLTVASFVFPPSGPVALNYFDFSKDDDLSRYIPAAIELRSSTLDYTSPLHMLTTTNSKIGEAVAAKDIVQISWTEPTDPTWPVTGLSIVCNACNEDISEVYGNRKWESCDNFTSTEVTTDNMVRYAGSNGVSFEIPEINGKDYSQYETRRPRDLQIVSVCAFRFMFENNPPADLYPVASQVFMVENKPREGKLHYAYASQYRYSYRGREPISNIMKINEGPAASLREQAQAKKKATQKTASIAISVVVAVLFVVFLFKCASKKTEDRPAQTTGSRELGNTTAEEARDRSRVEHQQQDGSITSYYGGGGANTAPPTRRPAPETSPGDAVSRPPPAYHEVVTDQENMLAQYSIQHMNVPVPTYAPRRGETSPV